MVNINYNSLHAKLYRWFYATKEMPINLCPYFWKTVIAFLLFIPVLLLTIPYYIVIAFQEDFRNDKTGEKICIGIVGYLAVYVLACMGLTLIHFLVSSFPTGSFWEASAIFGCVLYILALGVGFILWNERRKGKLKNMYYTDKITHEEYKRRTKLVPLPAVSHPREWLVIKFIKAWYGKNCPMVQWNTKN